MAEEIGDCAAPQDLIRARIPLVDDGAHGVDQSLVASFPGSELLGPPLRAQDRRRDAGDDQQRQEGPGHARVPRVASSAQNLTDQQRQPIRDDDRHDQRSQWAPFHRLMIAGVRGAGGTVRRRRGDHQQREDPRGCQPRRVLAVQVAVGEDRPCHRRDEAAEDDEQPRHAAAERTGRHQRAEGGHAQRQGGDQVGASHRQLESLDRRRLWQEREDLLDQEEADRADEEQVDQELGAHAPPPVRRHLERQRHRGEAHEGDVAHLGGREARRLANRQPVGDPHDLTGESGRGAGQQQQPREAMLPAAGRARLG